MICTTTKKLKNINSPFTEIFSLLKKNDSTPEKYMMTNKMDDLQIIQKHVDNAIDIILQGLNSMSQMFGIAMENSKSVYKDLNGIWFFVSALCNLVEALNCLRLGTSFILSQR